MKLFIEFTINVNSQVENQRPETLTVSTDFWKNFPGSLKPDTSLKIQFSLTIPHDFLRIFISKKIFVSVSKPCVQVNCSCTHYNPGHNILELYIILVQIGFTTSNMKLDI